MIVKASSPRTDCFPVSLFYQFISSIQTLAITPFDLTPRLHLPAVESCFLRNPRPDASLYLVTFHPAKKVYFPHHHVQTNNLRCDCSLKKGLGTPF